MRTEVLLGRTYLERQASNIMGIGRASAGVIMDINRSAIGLLSKIRGDTPDAVVKGAAPLNLANLAVYGTLASVALVILLKPSRK